MTAALAGLIGLLWLSIPAALSEAPPGASITVNAAQDIAPFPRRLLGTNVRQNMQDTPEIREFLRQTGITLFRYPDAVDIGYTWDWEAGGVMVQNGQPLIAPLARFDNVIDMAEAVGAEIFFTVKIHGSSPEEAARWVAEARERGLGGAYWCMGNEPYFRGSVHNIPKEDYVDLVNRFAPAMKEADPDIRIGIAWGGPWIETHSDPGRDSFILRETKQWVDFVDVHFYTGRFERDTGPDPKKVMAGALLVERHLRGFREIFQREAPEKADRLEIHYWEWGGPPWPQLGGMQNLATAVFVADALGEMARHGLAAAIQYNLQEHHCGLIPGFEQPRPDSWPTNPWNGRTIRPMAFSIGFWAHEMGPMLVEASAQGAGTYQTSDFHTIINYQGEVPHLAVHATRSEDRSGLQIMVINRDPVNAHEAQVILEGFEPKAQAEVILLHGPSALSHNDVADGDPPYRSFPDAPDPIVKPARSTFEGASGRFTYTFPAHSVTVLRLEAE